MAQDPDARSKLEDMLKGSGAKFGNMEDWMKNIKVEQPAGGAAGGSGGSKSRSAPARSEEDDLLGDDLLKDHDEL